MAEHLGKYKIDGFIAEGGMARILRAKTVGVGRVEKTVALKCLNGVMSKDDSYVQMIADATGFPADQITFVCYEEPRFVAEEGGRSISDYAQLLITVAIFAVLGYVVFRSTRTQKVEEMEPELSVETLLEATSESGEQLEDIGYNEKSEVRIMIEKFVDENPEAVAQLLRNWLNEDWE